MYMHIDDNATHTQHLECKNTRNVKTNVNNKDLVGGTWGLVLSGCRGAGDAQGASQRERDGGGRGRGEKGEMGGGSRGKRIDKLQKMKEPLCPLSAQPTVGLQRS